jgi:hypothetical protein
LSKARSFARVSGGCSERVVESSDIGLFVVHNRGGLESTTRAGLLSRQRVRRRCERRSVPAESLRSIHGDIPGIFAQPADRLTHRLRGHFRSARGCLVILFDTASGVRKDWKRFELLPASGALLARCQRQESCSQQGLGPTPIEQKLRRVIGRHVAGIEYLSVLEIEWNGASRHRSLWALSRSRTSPI